MIIGIDFDGVVSDSTRLKIREAKRIYGIDLLPENCSIRTAEEAGLSREQYKELVRRIYGTELFLEADEVAGACRSLQLLNRDNLIHIVTSRDDQEADFAKKFLEKRKIPYDKFTNTSNESKLSVCQGNNIDSFIDDTYENLVDLSICKFRLYLFSTPSNRNITIEHPDIKRANNWKELYRFLKAHCK